MLGDVDLAMSQLTREFLNRSALLQIHRAEGMTERVGRAPYTFDISGIAEARQDIFDATLAQGLAMTTQEQTLFIWIPGMAMNAEVSPK